MINLKKRVDTLFTRARPRAPPEPMEPHPIEVAIEAFSREPGAFLANDDEHDLAFSSFLYENLEPEHHDYIDIIVAANRRYYEAILEACKTDMGWSEAVEELGIE